MTKTISLALQGGGSHGAFTWGVLDRLLEDERLIIEAISGSSAGAMNAAALLSGYATGGREGAREALQRFWNSITQVAAFSPLQRSWVDQWMGNWGLDHSPGYQWSNWLASMASPYQLNPLNISPLRDVLTEQIDMDAMRTCADIGIFVAATNVRTGRARLFNRDTLTVDALLASACLPHLYQAVEIDGEAYWDGGYMGNPVIWPLVYNAQTADVILVQINPLVRDEVPRTPDEINHRLDEITFNSSLLHEMRAIAFVQHLLEKDALKEPWASQYKNVRMHCIGDSGALTALGASSKFNAEASFIDYLKDLGRDNADTWINEHFQSLGKHSTLNVRSTFL